MFKSFVVSSLARSAKRVLTRQAPMVIGVTGSVGKSSAKEAIAVALGGLSAGVRASQKNFNTEIGLPLAILGLPNGGRSFFKWWGILRRAKRMARVSDPSFAKTLVLEMGVDHPGDMDELLAIVRPEIGVVTSVGEAHLEFFKDVEEIAREKGKLIAMLPADGWAILNHDDPRVWEMRNRTKAQVVSFGFAKGADVEVLEHTVQLASDPDGDFGMHVRLMVRGTEVPIFLPGMLGMHSLYAVLAGFTVAAVRGMNMLTIAENLKKYEAPVGRMRALKGVKRTLLIDDTYNASPRSTLAALDVLKVLKVMTKGDDKKIAVLGDMLELGAKTREYHEEIGRAAVAAGCDVMVFVGEKMGDAMQAAVASGASRAQVAHFASADEAGRYVQQIMKQGDVVLVKGSQGMRMEKVVKELMAEPLRAKELLVRQEEEWVGK